jgi:hypothetical protein
VNANDSPSEARSSGTEKIWSGALAVAGAAVGLAAIIYFLGAASMWLALRGRGYSPDAAIEHQPRSQLIAIGMRGIVAVAIIVLLAAAFAMLLGRILPVNVLGAVVMGVIAIFVASWISWRLVALAFAASMALLVSALDWKPDMRTAGKAPLRWLVLLVAAVLTALAWQYGGPIRMTRVSVLPRSSLPFGSIYVEQRDCETPEGQRAESSAAYVRHWVWLKGKGNGCREKEALSKSDVEKDLRSRCNTVPYFGQSGDFVYLGAIRGVWLNKDGGCQWYAAGIVELPRDKVRLVFFNEKSNLNASRRRPIRAGWAYFRAFLGSFT